MLANSLTENKATIELNPWVQKGLLGVGGAALGATLAGIGVNLMKNKEIAKEQTLRTNAETAKTTAESAKQQLQTEKSSLETENATLKDKLEKIHGALEIDANADPTAKIQKLNSQVEGNKLGLEIFKTLKVMGKQGDEYTAEDLAKELDEGLKLCNECFKTIMDTEPPLQNTTGEETNLITSMKNYEDFSGLNFNDEKTKKNIFYTLRSLISALELVGCGRECKSDSDETISHKENYNQANNY